MNTTEGFKFCQITLLRLILQKERLIKDVRYQEFKGVTLDDPLK